MDSNKYMRVYFSIRTDERFANIYGNDRALAMWLRLLMDAEMAWPLPATIPLVHIPTFDLLVKVGLIDLAPLGMFRVHGLDAEREARANIGRTAANARWHAPSNARPMLERERVRERVREQRAPEAHRADVQAFADTVGRLPSVKQRALLDGLLDTHDVTGPSWAAAIITANPDDPIGAVIKADQQFRAERIEAAEPYRTVRATRGASSLGRIENAMPDLER